MLMATAPILDIKHTSFSRWKYAVDDARYNSSV